MTTSTLRKNHSVHSEDFARLAKGVQVGGVIDYDFAELGIPGTASLAAPDFEGSGRNAQVFGGLTGTKASRHVASPWK
jgi:hypothetical protein